ncbi:hypothetical protein Pcinc_015969 [Petrolisthes cinctipes]|uniref:Uncharacterized protein n=1 Tax=Petrolisthes cinctipes TaxID=88211 RepID=A0AAE1FS04_PETCI|nr:hypothetical protein Pcinc_015969 [Petrolisthes cinctipes]
MCQNYGIWWNSGHDCRDTMVFLVEAPVAVAVSQAEVLFAVAIPLVEVLLAVAMLWVEVLFVVGMVDQVEVLFVEGMVDQVEVLFVVGMVAQVEVLFVVEMVAQVEVLFVVGMVAQVEVLFAGVDLLYVEALLVNEAFCSTDVPSDKALPTVGMASAMVLVVQDMILVGEVVLVGVVHQGRPTVDTPPQTHSDSLI